jgi:hypothetical protein
MKRCIHDHQVRIAADSVLGFGGRKALSSMDEISSAEVLRLRATSAVSRDSSVRRSAQDDESVGWDELWEDESVGWDESAGGRMWEFEEKQFGAYGGKGPTKAFAICR